MAPTGEPERVERELIGRVVASDDHAAFGDLVSLHQSSVRQFLRRLTRQNPERADDLAQETFWKAYRYLASYRGEGRFRSWLFKIAYQLFVTQERRRRKVELRPLAEEPEAAAIGGEQVAASRTVDSMLSHLRDEERAAILLHYRHGLTHEEVAASMRLPLGTVKTLIRRGRGKMKQAHEAGRRAK